ncbi:MAG: hypothetical protein DCF25_13705 [Leptolyngbya foveolarum]|uniref:Uncharacterized protein n=1 Tax=Leptolyngbya foveolarum TaxID=47253 RepID=A0A2W4VSS9_9CYAN|nr:MAG: hypothetical protein DCF25_13705 [Leptolyngbya foveolarum]
MTIEYVLNSFRHRISWPTISAILKRCELPVSRGWDETIKKLIEYESKEKDVEASIKQLDDSYREYLLVGNKAVRAFNLDKGVSRQLIKAFSTHTPPETPFSANYPFPLKEEDLGEIDSSTKLVEVREVGKCWAIVFCTKRVFTERTSINPTDYNDEVKEALGGYDEVFGVKSYLRQLFDVVLLRPDTGISEVRLDVGSGISALDRSRYFSELIINFNNLALDIAGVKVPLKEPINFFPLIDSLYESHEGKVGEIAFTTDEGSIKFEKMRKTDADLREETYHKAGRKAVDHINLYRVALLWKYKFQNLEDVETAPELLLPGKSFFLNQEFPLLEEVIISKCSGLEDYEFVFEKISFYLGSRG